MRAVEHHEGVSLTLVSEGQGLDSVCVSAEVRLRSESVKCENGALVARDGQVGGRVNRGCGIERGEGRVVLTVRRAASVTGDRIRVSADGQVVRRAADANLSFEETTIAGGCTHRNYWSRERVVICGSGGIRNKIAAESEVRAVDGDRRAGDLVLDSELSVDEPLLGPDGVWPDLHALVCDAEELEDHLVVGDPGSDGDLVGHDEPVVVVWRNVAEGDGIGLFSSSSHAELLVAVWVIVEVLVFSGVRHEEGVVVLNCWVVSPGLNSSEPVGF